ncbi:MAG: glutamine-hydrolyzing GMP synthase [Phototrophicaceae bacterium]
MLSDALRSGGVVILDYGSQYTQLIARRVRELQVYAEVFPYDAEQEKVLAHQPSAFILSGSPASVYEPNAPTLPTYVLDYPTLGICYGMQLLTHHLGGQVAPSSQREYGSATVHHDGNHPLLKGLPTEFVAWMSHGDRLEALAQGFQALATSDNAPYVAIAHREKPYYAVQFHPEVSHTPLGTQVLANFLFELVGCHAKWSTGAFIEDAIRNIQAQVGKEGRVLLGLSGGVDSAVAGTLIQQAIGDRLTAVFVDNGLLRLNEAREVIHVFKEEHGMNLVAINGTEAFLSALTGITEPEQKRKIIGKTFIDLFTEQARQLSGTVRFLAQGTIYPDVIESAAHSKTAHVIKSHHNVGGLPKDLPFELVEPLRDLFKDEVRRVGESLGLPASLVWRQPFPGPGLAIRCLGEITWERLEKLRHADYIFTTTLNEAGYLRRTDGHGSDQAFAVLLPVKAVGVMGDQRTYQEVIALRAVATDDFMTADWARLPMELLAKASRRIVNEVAGVNRVVYDITSKPPGTIEWE